MFLSALIFLPVLMALLVWLFPSEKYLKPFALALSIAEFVLSLFIFNFFDSNQVALQMVEDLPWIKSLGVSYLVGIDGISIWLVLLTTFLTPITILGGWSSIQNKMRGFLMCILLLETTMLGTFLAMDAILFYVFFEASLVPMYFMIGIWGGHRRIYATIKFFIYTMTGSVLMLVAIITMMFMVDSLQGQSMSSSLLDFYKLNIPFVAGSPFATQTLLFFAFAFAFAIKVPMFPFHTWLPDAHVEAPTPGSVILAGVMLKMGSYGFMRFCIPLFPQAIDYWGWIFLVLAVVGIVYGALVAMVQPDMKKLVAYSSVSHMGYVMLGLFALNSFGVNGSLYQMLNHGISTGALFLLVGMVYERTHSREIVKYGQLAAAAPIYTIFFIIVTLSSIAVPLTNGFIGEFMILMGAYLSHPIYAYIAVTGVVLGATYMLWMVKKVFFGDEGQAVRDHREDLEMNYREILTMVPLVILIFWMGIYPQTFLNVSKASVEHLLSNRYTYSLEVTDNSELKDKKVVGP